MHTTLLLRGCLVGCMCSSLLLARMQCRLLHVCSIYVDGPKEVGRRFLPFSYPPLSILACGICRYACSARIMMGRSAGHIKTRQNTLICVGTSSCSLCRRSLALRVWSRVYEVEQIQRPIAPCPIHLIRFAMRPRRCMNSWSRIGRIALCAVCRGNHVCPLNRLHHW